jgi:hypothetical protein
MAAGNHFDFESYLKVLDPHQTYNIEELAAGVCNVVIRAIKQDPSVKSCFPLHKTLILKHAKAYFLRLGPGSPMSLVRQVDIISEDKRHPLSNQE